ncbi:MAG: LbtU family siderophore porin [Coxiellaceae bacterium]|nr:LbtU family siderophore porin [Coxiellaceae bacterium]
MKRILLPMTAVAAFALASPSFAADDSDALAIQVKQLNAQTKKLQSEVASLREKEKQKKAGSVQKPIVGTNSSSPAIQRMWEHYITVTTVPFSGKQLAYNGSDLLCNVSSMNEDVTLLQQKQDVLGLLAQQGHTINRPVLQVSGAAQGQLYSSRIFDPASANNATTSGLALSTAELDFNAMASSWATAFMALDYSGSPVSQGNRNPNATIYLSRGFVTIGNLDKSPVYFTIGQMYSPFGRYSTSMVSTPETQSLMEIRTPTAILGYSAHNLVLSAYTYEGSDTSGSDSMFEQGGVNATYKLMFGDNRSFNVGAGWASNIADSQGMQGTGYSTSFNGVNYFAGFGSSTGSNNLVHSVDGADVNATLALGPVTMLAEYITALRAFSPLDLTFNGVGAKPAAEHVEMDYLLPFFAKRYGTTLGASFDHASQSLALNLEQDKYAVFLNTSIWRETIESIEYNYQTDYSKTTTANGSTSVTPANTNIVGSGKGVNTVLLQVGVYF